MNQSYSDQPTDHDELGIAKAVTALTAIIADPHTDNTPLTIGIYGTWGSGKTSMMLMLKQQLAPGDQPPAVCLPIWFDAWRYTQTDVLWRALLLSIVEAVRTEIVGNKERLRTLLANRSADKRVTLDPDTVARKGKQLEAKLADLSNSLYRSIDREESGALTIDWGKAGKAAAGTALRIGIASLPLVGNMAKELEGIFKTIQNKSDKSVDLGAFAAAVQREKEIIYREHVKSLEQFFRGFDELMRKWIVPAGFRLVIFIDDLDRCLPDQTIGVLEALKVFLDVQGCVFVLGMDRAIIEQGIRVRFQAFALSRATEHGSMPIESRDYMEKIIQLPFEIPPVDKQSLSHYLYSRLDGIDAQGRRRYNLSADQARHVAEVITIGIDPNPRKLKRAYNLFRLIWQLVQANQQPVEPALIAKLVVLQISYSDVYGYIVGDSRRLIWIESYACKNQHAHGTDQADQDTITALCARYPRLVEMLSNNKEKEYADFERLVEQQPGGLRSYDKLNQLLLRSQRIIAE